MSKAVNDLVAYLAGESGENSDRCRRALADPASDLSLFLASARERSRAAIAEPAFRGLGLSPAACLPADSEEPSDQVELRLKHWLPWIVAAVAVLVAGLAIWSPWRAGPGPAPRGDEPTPVVVPVVARPASVDTGVVPGAARPVQGDEKPADARLGPDKPGAAVPNPIPVEVSPTPKAPDVALPPTKVAGVGRPAAPVNPAADDPAKAVEPLAKRLEAAEARVAVLERENDKLRAQAAAVDRDNSSLRTQVGAMKRDADRAAQAHAACESRSAAQQKVIDGLKAEAAKLQGQVVALEAQLKARPPIDSGPAKPKIGLPPPDLKGPVDPNKKKP
ncbi:MAG TPA: hypothetical protein VKD90_25490 [Gemmataceae bacterium]|nr:hypothetical protein [Gemmataceae bacterium]